MPRIAITLAALFLSSIAAHADWSALEVYVVVAAAFLGCQCQKINFLGNLDFIDGVESAGEQDFIDQPIQLGDIPFQSRLALWVG